MGKDVAESVTKRPCSCIHDEGVEETLNVDAIEAVDSVADSGVTMGWLLRLVTPLVVGGPRQFYFILNQSGEGP